MNLWEEDPFHLIDWHDLSEGVGGCHCLYYSLSMKARWVSPNREPKKRVFHVSHCCIQKISLKSYHLNFKRHTHLSDCLRLTPSPFPCGISLIRNSLPS